MSSSIIFVTASAGTAGHFHLLADALPENCQIEIYASKEAFSKFSSFSNKAISLHCFNPESDLNTIKGKCIAASTVITDIGHPFAEQLIKQVNKKTSCYAYYDNMEKYVPGGYSAIAGRVAPLAKAVFFANANLAKSAIYQDEQNTQIVCQKKIGIGLYPLQEFAKDIAKKRQNTK